MDLHPFKIVVLNNPISTWDDPLTRELFCKMVALKQRGYGSEYPNGIHPFDGTENFATHLMICRTGNDGELDPVVVYKSVTLERCDQHRMAFPALNVLNSSKADVRGLQKIMDESRLKKIPLSYDSAWTMHPLVRKDREIAHLMRDLTTTIGVYHHVDYNIPTWAVVGVKRFKTDQYFRWMGHEDIVQDFSFYGLFEEPSSMLHLTRYSEDSIKVAKRHEKFWKNSLRIESADSGELKKVA